MNTLNIIATDNNNQVTIKEKGKDLNTLQDLLMPGTVEPGFYVAAGSRELVPWIMDQLVGFLQVENETQNTPGKPVAPADIITSPNSLAIQSQIGKLLWIDSGNTFDPYRMALTSVRRGLNPTRILRALQVARPFTAFQFQQMLDKIPAPTLLKIQQKGRASRLVWRRPLVIVSDLMKLFYDEEIQDNDVKRAFRDFLVRLSFLSKRAIVLGVHLPYAAPSSRVHFLSQVLGLATRIRSYSTYSPFSLEALHRRRAVEAPMEHSPVELLPIGKSA